MREHAIWEIDDRAPVTEGLDEEGRADPAYAARLGLRRAPFGRRTGAAIIDSALWLILQLPFWLGAAPLLVKIAGGAIVPSAALDHPGFTVAVVTTAVTSVSTLALVIVHVIVRGTKGVTAGTALCGIRAVNLRTLARPGVGAVIVRSAVVLASLTVPVFGSALVLASPTFDPERRGRGLHDMAGGLWLVDVRAGLDPYDQKRMRVARKRAAAVRLEDPSVLPSLATPRDSVPAHPEYRAIARTSAGVVGVARAEVPPTGMPAAAFVPSVEGGGAASDQDRSTRRGSSRRGRARASAKPIRHGARFALRFDTGQSVVISEPTLLGRAPDAAAFRETRAVVVVDAARSLSKTHLLVQPVDHGLEVADQHSTNGSGVLRGGIEYGLAPGSPVVIIEGDSLRLGDRVAEVVAV